MHPKSHPNGVRTHDLQVMDSTCVSEMLALTTEQSGTTPILVLDIWSLVKFPFAQLVKDLANT